MLSYLVIVESGLSPEEHQVVSSIEMRWHYPLDVIREVS